MEFEITPIFAGDTFNYLIDIMKCNPKTLSHNFIKSIFNTDKFIHGVISLQIEKQYFTEPIIEKYLDKLTPYSGTETRSQREKMRKITKHNIICQKNYTKSYQWCNYKIEIFNSTFGRLISLLFNNKKFNHLDSLAGIISGLNVFDLTKRTYKYIMSLLIKIIITNDHEKIGKYLANIYCPTTDRDGKSYNIISIREVNKIFSLCTIPTIKLLARYRFPLKVHVEKIADQYFHNKKIRTYVNKTGPFDEITKKMSTSVKQPILEKYLTQFIFDHDVQKVARHCINQNYPFTQKCLRVIIDRTYEFEERHLIAEKYPYPLLTAKFAKYYIIEIQAEIETMMEKIAEKQKLILSLKNKFQINTSKQ